MLITKKLKIKIGNGQQKLWYNQKGYNCNIKDEIIINVEDLPNQSTIKVEVKCDYCGEIFLKDYRKYKEVHNQEKITQKDCCKKCIYKKDEETNLIKYNVKTTLLEKTTKEKIKNTIIKEYGVDNIMKSTQIREKSKQTLLNKYGVPYTWNIPEVKEKSKKTLLGKYGFNNAGKIPEFIEKREKTCLDKYGVKNILNNGPYRDKIREKSIKSASENNSVNISKSQLYLVNLYDYECNFPIKYYVVDGKDKNNKIYLEYDGSGHKLAVLLGYMTEKEFEDKERKRYHILRQEGYKLFQIINYNSRDKLPDDEVLLQMKEIAEKILQNEEYIHFNLDEKVIETHNVILKWDYKKKLAENEINNLLFPNR